MTAAEIARLIEHPEQCGLKDVSDLEALAQKYPYAQSFPILLLQTLGRNKDLRFEEALSKNAYKVSDRMHLYYLINGESEILPAKEEETSISIEPTPVETVSEIVLSESEEKIESILDAAIDATDLAEEPEIDGLEEQIIEIQETKDATANEIESIRESIEISAENDLEDFRFLEVEEMNFEPVRIEFEEDTETLTKEIEETEEIVHSELEIDANELSPLSELEPKETEIELADAEVAVPFEDEKVSNIVEIQNFEEDEPIGASLDEKEEISENKDEILREEDRFDPTIHLEETLMEEELEIIQPSSFEIESKAIDFGMIISSENAVENEITSNAISEGFATAFEKEEKVQEEQNVAQILSDFEKEEAQGKRTFTDWLKASATTHSEEYQVKQQRTEEIVSKFLQDEPKITRISKTEESEKKAAEFFKVSKIAKASLSEKAIPVSVTLAQIFEAQGNFTRAIESYEQLILLNPEKKSFFANQIKELQKKINK